MIFVATAWSKDFDKMSITTIDEKDSIDNIPYKLETEKENRYDVDEIRSIHWDMDYYCYRKIVRQ